MLTIASGVAGGLAVLCFAIADSLGFYVIMGLFFVYVGMAMPQYSIAVAHTNDHLERDQMVGASSTMYIISGVGSTLGPILASYMMDLTDAPRAYFVYLACMHAVLLGFALYRMTRRASTPLDEQGPSAVFTYSGTVASTMYAEEYGEALEDESGKESDAAKEESPPEPIAAEDVARNRGRGRRRRGYPPGLKGYLGLLVLFVRAFKHLQIIPGGGFAGIGGVAVILLRLLDDPREDAGLDA